MVGIVIHDNDGCNAANDGKNKMMIDMVQNSNRRRPPQINGSWLIHWTVSSQNRETWCLKLKPVLVIGQFTDIKP